jgi:hypothetical protein
MINGSYWIGTAVGSLVALPLLDTNLFAVNLGWRFAFGLGAVLGVAIMFVRRNVPESPRWMVIHGHNEEAEALVADIERQVKESTGASELPPAERSITIRQRRGIGEVIGAIVKLYPSRAIVGLALMTGQAFLYNAIFFTYALVLTKFYGISDSSVPLYLLPFAIGNFFGPLLLGPLFDTWGRKKMIALTYVLSGVLLIITGWLFQQGVLTAVTPDDRLGCHLLLRLRRRRLPDRQRDLPDGNPRDGHLGLLRLRHGDRWHAGAGHLRPAHRDRQRRGGVRRLRDRRRTDDRGGHRRVRPRRRGGGPRPGGHRQALDRPGCRGGRVGGGRRQAGRRRPHRGGRRPHRATPRGGRAARRAGPGPAGRAGATGTATPRGAVPPGARRSDFRTGFGQTPGSSWSPYMPDPGAGGLPPDRGHEIDQLVAAVRDAGGRARRDELTKRVNATAWGPGRFAAALREAVADGRIRQVGRGQYEVGPEREPGPEAPARS